MAVRKTKETADPSYTGAQLARSEHFRELRDVAEAVLNADEMYTLKDADKIVQNYMKGKVI